MANRKTVLIVDDDRLFCDSAAEYLAGAGIRTLTAYSAEETRSVVESTPVDVLLLDQHLPDAEGHALCEELNTRREGIKIIFVTAAPSFDHAVKAVRAGAYDYLSKPVEPAEMELAVNRALQALELERNAAVGKYENTRTFSDTDLVGIDGGLRGVAESIRTAAGTDAPALLTGETGTGKSRIAREIHRTGPRSGAPFIDINCAALPADLIESELFGHDRGAFTGADENRPGIFELADGGTLLLDEIGEMPLQLQAKLLGVLDTGEVRRLGGRAPRTVDVRIIAATNVDIEKAVEAGAFRRDLYYRLGVLRIHVPPLRERKDDIGDLARQLLRDLAPGRDCSISTDEARKLASYPWPGNIRELRNVLERCVIANQGTDFRPSAFIHTTPDTEGEAPRTFFDPSDGSPLTLEQVEREHLRRTLRHYAGNLARTARALEISLSTVKRKIKRYGLAGSK